jgi:N-acyl-L-homoserine lactone synthetase
MAVDRVAGAQRWMIRGQAPASTVRTATLEETPLDPSEISRKPAYMARPVSLRESAMLEAAYRLRAAVFERELGWLPSSRDRRERDRCDEVAQHFAAFTSAGSGAQLALVGYARVVLPHHGFMLEREFAALLAGHTLEIAASRAFEVSRFVVHPLHRGRLDGERRSAADHLARAIVRWALARDRTDWHSVCEVRHVRALRLRGLPFARIGQVVEYQPGVQVCAARLHLPHAAAWLRTHRSRDYDWYMEGAQCPW